MAYREVDMWEILDVLQQVGCGKKKTEIARATGYSRSTIRRYVAVAEAQGWCAGVEEPTEAVALAVFERLNLRSNTGSRRPGEVEAYLFAHQERIKQWLDPAEGDSRKRGLRLTKVHQLLAREGVVVAYSSLHRFAVKHCGFHDRRRLSVRVADCEPGEVAEVDFGRLGLIPDGEREGPQRRVAHALIVTLCYSRHQYVHVTHSQQLPDLIGGLEDAFWFFGGVTRRLIIDNLKAAVIKPDRYDPTFMRTFGEYARHRGFEIDAANVRHPKGKPKVERNVQYVRESFFRGEEWLDLGHLQRGATHWCLQLAGTRTHGTTRERPLAVFENVEKQRLLPLEKERFDTPRWSNHKVHPDHHISCGKALYSVPTKYLHKSACVRSDSKLVRIYVGGQLVKTHPVQAPGGRSTDYNDYPEELVGYAMRDPQRLIGLARSRGEHLGRFMEELLSGTLPWAKLRQGQRLLRLGDKYGTRRTDSACSRALAFEVINVKRVEAIIRANLDQAGISESDPREAGSSQAQLRFMRQAESFSHSATPPTKEIIDHGRSETIAQDGAQATETLRDSTHTARQSQLCEEDRSDGA